MKKYNITLFLIIMAAAINLSAMEESIKVKLTGDEEATISPKQFESFKAIIDPDIKSMLEEGGSITLPSTEQKGFDFIIKNIDSFKNNDTKAINAALDQLKDAAIFASMLESAHYFDSKNILTPITEYIKINIDNMLKNTPEFVEAILELQKKYKGELQVIDINAPIKGRTLLLRAVRHKRPKIVQQLIEAGADVNLQDKAGATPLLGAALKGDNETLELLIKAGANLFAVSKKFGTALSQARKKDNKDAIELLKKAGIEYIIQNVPEHKSAETYDLWGKLEEYYRENNSEKFLAFLEAAANAKNQAIFKTAAMLLGGLNQLSFDDEEFMTYKEMKDLASKYFDALYAFLERNDKMAEMHESRGAIIRQAVILGNIEAAKKLLEFGANINTTDMEGNSLLADAVTSDQLEMFTFLLEQGADPDLRGLDYGYYPPRKSSAGQSARTRAFQSKNKAFRKILKNYPQKEEY